MSTTPEMRRFGRQLRNRRKELRYTGVALCRLIGISSTNLSNIESGRNYPSLTVYLAICRSLELPKPPLT